jgi:type I phosphodiesterase/nucleotide pyrophosphatase
MSTFPPINTARGRFGKPSLRTLERRPPFCGSLVPGAGKRRPYSRTNPFEDNRRCSDCCFAIGRWIRNPIATQVALLALASGFTLGCSSNYEIAKLAAVGDVRELRTRNNQAAANATHPSLLILGIDGMKRDVLYNLLENAQLPGLESLLGGRTNGRLAHAYLDRSMLAPFPSVTLTGWASIFTGAPPAVSGIPGNEFFIREQRRFVAPIPCSFYDKEPVLETYTDDYANKLLEVPTVYERLRTQEPEIDISVSVSQFYRGADRLLIAQRSALIDMFYAKAKDIADGKAFAMFEERDRNVLDVVIDEVEDDDHPVPDVLTVYASGTDAYAHAAPEGPDRALQRFMTGKVDKKFAELAEALQKRDAFANRYIVVVSDHGHSEVPHDATTMLSSADQDAPPAVLTGAGFRVRPLQLNVAENDDFDAVLAYQGPIAYVYVADRSKCAKKGAVCDWSRPPRFREDVLKAAQAYFDANRSGRHAPRMKNTLDMILTRRPRPFAEDDLPFEVYVGHGKLVPLKDYLRMHPHPNWIAFESRLRDLAVGRYGERAGDVILVARNGHGAAPEGRYYFSSSRQESVHGSASQQDSEVVMILAHPGRSVAELESIAHGILGRDSRSRQVTDLVLRLRESPPATRPHGGDGGP